MASIALALSLMCASLVSPWPAAQSIPQFGVHVAGVVSLSQPSPSTRPTVPCSPCPSAPPADKESTAPLPGDWSQLFPGLVGTFVGALLAVWAAVWMDRVGRRRADRSRQESAAERVDEVFELIEREIKWNSREIQAILVDLDSELRTDRSPMTDAWNAVGPEVMKACNADAASLSEAFALLSRCRRLLEQYTSDLALGGRGVRTAREQTLPRLRELIRETTGALDVARSTLHERSSSR